MPRLSGGIELQAPKYEDRIFTSQQESRKSRSTNSEPQESYTNHATRGVQEPRYKRQIKRVELQEA